jgi:palmitoyl transferase
MFFPKSRLVLFVLLLFSFAPAWASGEKPSWAKSAYNRLDQIWTQGNYDLYLSGYAWHNRATYTPEKIRGYNERAWGGGLGKSIYDEDGDWQGLYAMAFLESHSKVQPIAGYGFQKIGKVGADTRFGLGYTVFVTSHPAVMKGVPFPGILPLVSVGYKNATLYATYIPGGRGAGNVLFMFGRWAF